MPLLTKGLGRLVREGAVFATARYPYAATYTAPGHAALGTGAPPSQSGIIANEWWDRESSASVESVTDAGYPLLAVGGWRGELETGWRQSPFRLRVDGVADALRAATAGTGKAVGVSLKSRAAMFATGRHADMAIWYDPQQRAFTTSTWYARELPGWLALLAREHPIGPRLADDWQALDPALLARETGLPDDAPGEASGIGFGKTFPHRPLELPDPAESIKTTPLGNTVVVEAALAAVDGLGLGRDDVPDYLAVSFSATDYVGHAFGQESWESLDMLLRLDGDVATLLAGLEERAGAGRVAVVLSSDHGAPRMPEQHPGTLRVDPADVARAADRAIAGVAGAGTPWVVYGRDPTLYLAARFRALDAGVRERALDAAVAAAKAVPGIGYAVRTDQVQGNCDGRADPEALYCRALDGERSGEILFGPAPGGLIFDKERDAISHGSTNDDDRTVPVVVWGAGVSPGRHDEVVSALQVAPTLARLLGVPPPARAQAQALPIGNRHQPR
jgi:arylsulfatase A-like enzyme